MAKLIFYFVLETSKLTTNILPIRDQDKHWVKEQFTLLENSKSTTKIFSLGSSRGISMCKRTIHVVTCII